MAFQYDPLMDQEQEEHEPEIGEDHQKLSQFLIEPRLQARLLRARLGRAACSRTERDLEAERESLHWRLEADGRPREEEQS
jgi:hypothetical protein